MHPYTRLLLMLVTVKELLVIQCAMYEDLSERRALKVDLNSGLTIRVNYYPSDL